MTQALEGEVEVYSASSLAEVWAKTGVYYKKYEVIKKKEDIYDRDWALWNFTCKVNI